MDTTTKPHTETEKLFADLNKPSLVGLSYALRHPELWPSGFTWNYKSCKTCAMGLAHQLWSSRIPEGSSEMNRGATIMAKAFHMPFSSAQAIFMGRIGNKICNWVPTKQVTKTSGALWWKKTTDLGREGILEAITPEMVADQIDEYLATAE